MTIKKENLVEKVQQSYRQLSTVAADLNLASDKLGAAISNLDASLRKLNLGISGWVHFSEWGSDDGLRYQYDDIGYTKIGGKWTLAIRSVSGCEQVESDDVDQWPFNEAPRGLRVRAVLKVPELLDQLIKEATGLIKTIDERVEVVDLLAAAMSDADAGIKKTNIGQLMSATSSSARITVPATVPCPVREGTADETRP